MSNKTCVFAKSFDEYNLIEWMQHYYSIGFDFIIIYDDNSESFGSIQNFIDSQDIKIDKNKYHIIDKFKFSKNNKIANLNDKDEFYAPLFKIIRSFDIKYLLYVDLDEYLILKHFNNIQQVIEKYSPFDELTINWLLFGNSNIKKSDGKSMLNVFVHSHNKLNIHVKSFVKMDSVIAGCNPHRLFTKRSSIYKNIYNEVIDNYYTNMYDDTFKRREDGVNFFTTIKDDKLLFNENIPMYIAHYVISDTTNFYRRRYLNYDSSRRHEIEAKYANPIFTKLDIHKLLHDKADDIIEILFNEDNTKIEDLIKKYYENESENYKTSVKESLLKIFQFYTAHNLRTQLTTHYREANKFAITTTH